MSSAICSSSAKGRARKILALPRTGSSTRVKSTSTAGRSTTVARPPAAPAASASGPEAFGPIRRPCSSMATQSAWRSSAESILMTRVSGMASGASLVGEAAQDGARIAARIAVDETVHGEPAGANIDAHRQPEPGAGHCQLLAGPRRDHGAELLEGLPPFQRPVQENLLGGLRVELVGSRQQDFGQGR